MGYGSLNFKVFNGGYNPPTPPAPTWEYDLVDDNEYDRIDILYTTDQHGYCVGGVTFSGSDADTVWKTISTSSGDNSIESAKLKLANATNLKIKPLLIDGGDIARRKNNTATTNNYGPLGEKLMSDMNTLDYFLLVPGNNDMDSFATASGSVDSFNYYDSIFRGSNVVNKACTACNVFDTSTGKLIYKPYRSAKIGSKKIGIIGASFGSPDINALNNNKWIKYSFLNYEELYEEVQKYIDLFIENQFDYIGFVYHMNETGSTQYYARNIVGINDVIQHTSGLTFATIGHSHNTKSQYTINDKSGNTVTVLAQPRCYNSRITHAKISGSKKTDDLVISSVYATSLSQITI